jgi:hypothetical protein
MKPVLVIFILNFISLQLFSQVSTLYDDDTIPAFAPFMPVVKYNGFGCRDLLINPGASVTINPGITLIVTGSVTIAFE